MPHSQAHVRTACAFLVLLVVSSLFCMHFFSRRLLGSCLLPALAWNICAAKEVLTAFTASFINAALPFTRLCAGPFAVSLLIYNNAQSRHRVANNPFLSPAQQRF